MGGREPLLPGKGGGKEEGRKRGCLLKGAYGWGGVGGQWKQEGNQSQRHEVESKAWWSPTRRPGRDRDGISPCRSGGLGRQKGN